jgi:hypothetical protein
MPDQLKRMQVEDETPGKPYLIPENIRTASSQINPGVKTVAL